MDRKDPFADIANDFAPTKSTRRPVDMALIDEASEKLGFPSRAAPKPPIPAPKPEAPTRKKQRRHTTGRNQQINIKATAEVLEEFYKIADERGLSIAETFEVAVTALGQYKSW